MYILDTNICIYIINNKPVSVRSKFASLGLADIAISSITLFELDAGARKGLKSAENLIRLEQFASLIHILAFDSRAAQKAGYLRQYLRDKGNSIGDMDTLIAAHALSVNGILVSNNLKEFERVPNLKLENWID